MVSAALDRALVLSALVHRAQARKGTRVPYVVHPVHVMLLLVQYGYGEPLTVAAVLHDLLEDVDVADRTLAADIEACFPGLIESRDEARTREAFRAGLERIFGHEVVRLVDALTDPPRGGETERPWIERRIALLERLTRAERDEAILKAADALHNVWSILEDVSLGRATLASRLQESPEQVLWYYREVVHRVRARAAGAPIVEDLERAVASLAGMIDRRGEPG